MIDLLLVNPGDISPYPAMGLAELAAYVRRAGYSVAIVDFSASDTMDMIPKAKARVIGLSVPCGLVRVSFELVKYIKKETNATVIFGGYYPTFCTKECLQNKGVDFAILGEGEIPLLGLLNNLIRQEGSLQQVPGIAYMAEGQAVSNPRAYISDLDSLPLPALDLLPLENYPRKAGKEFTGTLSTGRGCPFGCKFCSQSAFWERKVRFRSPQKVLEIVDMMVKKYSFNYIRILDDIFPLRPKEALQIATGLKERSLKWECQARIDSVSESLLREFAKTNLDRVFFGIESGSPKIQRATGKELKPEAIKRIIVVAREAGIRIKVSFQIGTPGETKEDVDLSIKLAQELDVDEIALFVSTPFPGIPLYQVAVENKLLENINPDDCDPSVASIGTGFMSREEVEQEAQRFLDSVEKATWGHHSKKGRVLRKLE